MPKLRVLIADDHPLLRNALRTIITDEADLELVAEVDNGQAAIEQTLALKPDVSVIDLYLPLFDGHQVIERVLQANPRAQLLVLTSSIEESNVARAVLAGALGYLIKDSDRPEILRAIREVGQGRAYLSPAVAVKLANSLRQQHAPKITAETEPLTQRELQVLDQIGAGASNADIARELNIGETTVRTHIHNILHKLGFQTRNHLMMYFLSQPGRK